MQNLKIEIIHDIVCSWCHIGYHNLEIALRKHSKNINVELHYLPFQLNPELDQEGIEINQFLRTRNQWTQQQADTYRLNLLATAAELGVHFDFNKRTRYYNTDLAHRLILYSQTFGKHQQMHKTLLHTYHVEGLNISKVDVLTNLAQRLGFNNLALETALHTVPINQQVANSKARVKQFSLRSVPAFIFNHNVFVAGSSSVTHFDEVIHSLLTDHKTYNMEES